MKERPILFSGPMVRAILAGDKTQTRRVIKPQPIPFNMVMGRPMGHDGLWPFSYDPGPGRKLVDRWTKCPYGVVGDRLWVRETWKLECPYEHADGCGNPDHVYYRALVADPDSMKPWRPSIFMPRWASRITLEITGIRVERVGDISEADVLAEGIDFENGITGSAFNTAEHYLAGGSPIQGGSPERFAFITLWDHINARRGYGWDINPWVWVIEFQRVA